MERHWRRRGHATQRAGGIKMPTYPSDHTRPSSAARPCTQEGRPTSTGCALLPSPSSGQHRQAREAAAAACPGHQSSVTVFSSIAAHHKCPTGTTSPRSHCILSTYKRKSSGTAQRGRPGKRLPPLGCGCTGWLCSLSHALRTQCHMKRACQLTHSTQWGPEVWGSERVAREGQTSCHGPLWPVLVS